jgi:hypothetical protein
MTADGGGLGAPRFDVVLRGYDRRQVDEHVAHLQRVLTRMRADLEVARSQPLPVQSPASGIPGQQAPGGRPAPRPRPGVPPQAGGEPPDMIGSFTDRMQSILQAAEEEAEEIRNKARGAARAEEEKTRAQLADLVRQRDGVLAELTRMRRQLEGMLGAPTARIALGPRDGAPQSNSGQSNSGQPGSGQAGAGQGGSAQRPGPGQPSPGKPGGQGGSGSAGAAQRTPAERQGQSPRPTPGGGPAPAPAPRPGPQGGTSGGGGQEPKRPSQGPRPAQSSPKPSPSPKPAPAPAPAPAPKAPGQPSGGGDRGGERREAPAGGRPSPAPKPAPNERGNSPAGNRQASGAEQPSSMRPPSEPEPEVGDLFRPVAGAARGDEPRTTAVPHTANSPSAPRGDRTTLVPTVAPAGNAKQPNPEPDKSARKGDGESTVKVGAVRPPNSSDSPRPAAGAGPSASKDKPDTPSDQGEGARRGGQAAAGSNSGERVNRSTSASRSG